MSDDCRQDQLNTVLLIADLVITAMVAVITTMRFRAKCGNTECTCKPKDQPRSPGSGGGGMPSGSVAVVMPPTSSEETIKSPPN